jgi:hypothetical protein
MEEHNNRMLATGIWKWEKKKVPRALGPRIDLFLPEKLQLRIGVFRLLYLQCDSYLS